MISSGIVQQDVAATHWLVTTSRESKKVVLSLWTLSGGLRI